MALSFLKVRSDFDEITEALTDEEKGRLLLAMIRYAQDGEEPQLTGRNWAGKCRNTCSRTVA